MGSQGTMTDRQGPHRPRNRWRPKASPAPLPPLTSGTPPASPTSQPLSMTLHEQLQRSLGDAYHIERELGGGGMSRVFVARDEALRRNVVVKVLPPDLVAGVNVERFHREIELAAGLQ